MGRIHNPPPRSKLSSDTVKKSSAVTGRRRTRAGGRLGTSLWWLRGSQSLGLDLLHTPQGCFSPLARAEFLFGGVVVVVVVMVVVIVNWEEGRTKKDQKVATHVCKRRAGEGKCIFY